MEQEKPELTPLDEEATTQAPPKQKGLRLTWRLLLLLVSLSMIATSLLTYTLTAAAKRKQYTAQLAAQQQTIQNLQDMTESGGISLLDRFIQQYSYYADSMDSKAMLEAACKAYVSAIGDPYARYYTAEEYEKHTTQNAGESCGIGVRVRNEILTIEDTEYWVFCITEFLEGSTAEARGLALGDMVYAICVDGAYKTINELGYDAASSAIRGEEGSELSLRVLRPLSEGGYESLEVTVIRVTYQNRSVLWEVSELDPKIGIVRIAEFVLNTPEQFKTAVNSLLAQGATEFVFDLRDNPGGDLQSIKAILSYFLQEGDLVLSAIDRTGAVAVSYRVEPTSLNGSYEKCSVAKEEIGMYADLSMVILCNENTASAAEVFTASMRDYGLAKTVGKTTFGKGILQTTRRVALGDTVGYVKLTTHAYVTHCGISYHGSGIAPDVGVELSEEAKKYATQILPQDIDAQLKTAVAMLRAARDAA